MDVELERMKVQQKSAVVGYLLWWFLGVFGGHRFYTGQSKAWLYIILGVIGFVLAFVVVGYFILVGILIWWIIDGVKLHKVIQEYNLQVLENYSKTHPTN